MKRCCVSGTWRTLFSRFLHRLPKAFSRCGSRLHSSPCMFHERSHADGHIDASALHAPQRLTNSDEVDVFYDDGWWLMTFMGTRRSASGTEYHVRSDLYQVERWVPADHVRPHWRRRGAKWRQLDQMRKQPAQAKAPPKKAESPSLKAAAPNVTGPAAAAAAPAKAAAAAPAKAAPLGKIASPSSEAGGARNGARPTKAASGSAPPPTQMPMTGTTQWPMTGTAGELCGQMLRWVGAWLACMCSPRRHLRPDAPVGRCLACMHVLTTAPSAARCSSGSVPGLHACAHHGALASPPQASSAARCSARCERARRRPGLRIRCPWWMCPTISPSSRTPWTTARCARSLPTASTARACSALRPICASSFATPSRTTGTRRMNTTAPPSRCAHHGAPLGSKAGASTQVLTTARPLAPKAGASMQVLTTARGASLLSLHARRSHAACPPPPALRPDDAHDDAPPGGRP